MNASPRLRALAVVAAALAGAAALDGGGGGGSAGAGGLAEIEPAPMPAMAAADAISSSWYCPGVPAPSDGSESGDVRILNTAADPVDVVLSALASDPATPSQRRALALGPGERVDVRLAELTPAPYAAAVVEVFGAGVVVEQTAVTTRGADTTPCTSSASATWYLASGSTTQGDQLVYTLLNPFPDDAVVDIDLATEQGGDQLDAVVVPARSLRVVQVDAVVRYRERVAASVVARAGRVVVGRVQKLTPDAVEAAPGEALDLRSGVAASLASPVPGTASSLALADKRDGVATRVVVYNPGESEAVAQVELRPEGGVDPAVGAPEPLELTIPAGTASTLDLSAEALVPAGRYALDVRSADDVPLVVERVVDWSAPTGTTGHSVTVASPRHATRWWLAGGEATTATTQQVVVANPGVEPVSVAFELPGPPGRPVPGGAPIQVPALGSAIVDLAALGAAVPAGSPGPVALVAQASGPVVVERLLFGAATATTPPHASLAVGVPADPVRPVVP